MHRVSVNKEPNSQRNENEKQKLVQCRIINKITCSWLCREHLDVGSRRIYLCYSTCTSISRKSFSLSCGANIRSSQNFNFYSQNILSIECCGNHVHVLYSFYINYHLATKRLFVEKKAKQKIVYVASANCITRCLLFKVVSFAVLRKFQAVKTSDTLN